MLDKNFIDFIGVGVMKSGTTWLSECLRVHPEICFSSFKETHFFSRYYTEKGYTWYNQMYKRPDKVCGEFSTSYFDNEFAIKRIKNDLPEIKIILILRDPVDRFLSHLKHVSRQENLKIPRELNVKDLKIIIESHKELINYSKYYKNLENLITTFGHSKVLILQNEEFEKFPKEVLKRTYTFLNVQSDFTPHSVNKKISKGIIPKFPILEVLRVKVFKFFKFNLPIIITIVRRLGIAETYRKLNTNQDDFQITKEGMTFLSDLFEDDYDKTMDLVREMDLLKKD